MLDKARPTMVLYPPALQFLASLSPVHGAVGIVREWLQDAGMPVDEYDIDISAAAIQVEGQNRQKMVITAPPYGDRAETLMNLLPTDPVATVEASQHFLMPVLDRLIDSGGPPTISGSMTVVDSLDAAPSLDEHRNFERLTTTLSETIGEVIDQKMVAYMERLRREEEQRMGGDGQDRGFDRLPGMGPGGMGPGGF